MSRFYLKDKVNTNTTWRKLLIAQEEDIQVEHSVGKVIYVNEDYIEDLSLYEVSLEGIFGEVEALGLIALDYEEVPVEILKYLESLEELQTTIDEYNDYIEEEYIVTEELLEEFMISMSEDSIHISSRPKETTWAFWHNGDQKRIVLETETMYDTNYKDSTDEFQGMRLLENGVIDEVDYSLYQLQDGRLMLEDKTLVVNGLRDVCFIYESTLTTVDEALAYINRK